MWPAHARRWSRPAGLTLAVAVIVGACQPPRDASTVAVGESVAVQEAVAEEGEATGRQPRFDLVESLRQDLAAGRHEADGGGRAWLEEPMPARVATAGRWTIVYQAGELGIAVGGMIYLQVSPFWGWSTPQVEQPSAPGFTEVASDAVGVALTPRTLDQQLLGITISGRALAAGEQVRILYGAGSAGAQADRFAERGSRFWIAVDGDGDGVRAVLEDSPSIDVAPGPAARLLAILPSTARPGETVRLTLSILDRVGNAGVAVTGEIRLTAPPGIRAPSQVVMRAQDLGRREVEITVVEPGVFRLQALGPGGLTAHSNPLQASRQGARILWGDLQNHSNASDGSATPEDHYLYARDVAALDVVSLTDHDHWGMPFLDQHPEVWAEMRRLARRFYQPGRFVTLLGYEWTNWIHGHRHVLFFGDDGPLLSSIDPAYDEPAELWRGLRGTRALTIAHHSAGGPIATDWEIAPDPELEPVTEVVSVHGSSEAADSPSLIHRPVPGNFVRDALDRGYRLGFLGSSDGHDGHPGLGHLASPTGGLAAILAEELTREAVYDALRSRRVYATSGPRIVLRATFGGHRMGAEIALDGGKVEGETVPGIAEDTLVVRAIAPGELERIDVVRSGRLVHSFDCQEQRECTFAAAFAELAVGEYVYVRVVQKDGGLAWSSPFYFIGAPAE